MPNLNKVILMGNLTRDPELRQTPNNTDVCQIGLAINRNYTDGGGEKQQETTFVDAQAWGKTGEVINQYLHKGDPIPRRRPPGGGEEPRAIPPRRLSSGR